MILAETRAFAAALLLMLLAMFTGAIVLT